MHQTATGPAGITAINYIKLRETVFPRLRSWILREVRGREVRVREEGKRVR